MQCVPRLPAANARSILKFIQSIQSEKVKQEKGWFTFYSDEIKEMNTTHKALTKQYTLNKLELPTEWEHMNTRIFQAEMGICHKFQIMQAILLNGNCQDKQLEVERLRNGILDTNSGILHNLSVIHRGLVGRAITNPTEKGLLEMWSKGIYDNMRINKMSAKLYQDYVEMYLAKAAILQFRGILLHTEANNNSMCCSHQLELFESNLKYQIEKMEKTVPTFMKYLTNPDEQIIFTLKPVFDGNDLPFVTSKGRNKKLGYDYMCEYTEEGKWIFKKSPNFDEDGSLLIYGRSRDGECNYVSLSGTFPAKCVSEESNATPFNVIPIEFSDKIINLKIIICKSQSLQEDTSFLGTSLTCIGEGEDKEFTISFDCN